MMRFNYLIVVMVLAFAKADYLTAQSKQERESRVERTEFPEAAQQLLDLFSQKGKGVKFYRETDGDAVSFEMKLKVNRRWRSVEFDENGRLEDIEVTIRKRRIAQQALRNIQEVLDSLSDKNKIEKVQLQFIPTSDNPQEMLDRLDRNQFDNYEIIAAFKEKRKIYRKELLFSSQGMLLQSRDIKRIAYDFLLF